MQVRLNRLDLHPRHSVDRPPYVFKLVYIPVVKIGDVGHVSGSWQQETQPGHSVPV